MTITALTDIATLPDQSQDQATFDANMAAMIRNLPLRAQQENELAANLNSIAAGGAYAIPYVFATSAGAVPFATYCTLSSANQSDSTSILISTVSAGNQAVNNLLGEFASSSSTVKGTIRLQKQTDPSKWIVLAVTSVGAVQSAGDGNGYRVLAVTPVGASGVAPFGNTDSLLLHFQHTGDKGNNGASVLLAQATVGSAVANIDFLNTFSSLYDKYVIEVEGMGSSGASSQFQMRLANGGTVDSSAVYSTLSGGGVTLTLGFAEFTLTNNDQPAALNATIEVRNANSTGMKSVGARGSYVPSGGANHRAILGEGDYTKSSAASGFRLFFSSGNITSGTVRVYGVINT